MKNINAYLKKIKVLDNLCEYNMKIIKFQATVQE